MTKPQLPSANDPDVVEWLAVNSIQGVPTVLSFQDEGYLPRFCHVVAKHHALENGGRRAHGWALWRFADAAGNTMIIAEHHSVWERPDATLVDITPPVSGGNHTLFVRDDAAVIIADGEGFALRTDRTNFSDMPRMLRGQPVPHELWRFDPAEAIAESEYAAALGFDWVHFPTEQDVG